MRGRIGLPARRRILEQRVAADRRIYFAAGLKLSLPVRLHPCELARGLLPMLRQIADNSADPFLQQVAQRNVFNRQPVHRPRGFERQPQQARHGGRALGHFLTQQFGEPQPTPGLVSCGRNITPGAERIEQRPQRLIEIEIADHRQARQQHPAA